MKFDKEKIEKLANLSMLSLTDEQKDMMPDQFNTILNYVEILQDVDTSDIKETDQVTSLTNVMDEDIVKPSLSQDDALSNAPDQENGYFKVKKVL